MDVVVVAVVAVAIVLVAIVVGIVIRAKRVSYCYIPKKKSVICACVRLVLVLVWEKNCACVRLILVLV